MAADTLTQLATPTLPLDRIKSNGNVRVDVGDVTELAASIKATGLHQPLEVVVVADGAGHPVGYLLDGHRRLAALRKLKWKEAPITVATELDGMASEEQRVAIQLVANMQRVDLTPIEEASGYAQLTGFGWKQNKIAKWLGRSEAHVSKRLSLLDLPDSAIDLAEEGLLGPESLYALSQAAHAGADVDGIIAQLAENHEDLDEPIQLEEVEAMTRAATSRAKAADDLSARKAEYEERGVEVIILEDLGGGHVPLPGDRIGWDVDLDWDAHLTEPCALMALYIRWGSVTESQHCTDRARHAPDGDSKLKLPEKKRSEEEKRKADAKRRATALQAAADAALEGRLPARDKVVDRVIALYLEDLTDYAHKRAAKLLGVGAELADEYKGLQALYEDADSTWRTKILLAAVLAHGYEKSAGVWNSLDDSHVAFLADIGVTYGDDT